jgi:hypothetical protein
MKLYHFDRGNKLSTVRHFQDGKNDLSHAEELARKYWSGIMNVSPKPEILYYGVLAMTSVQMSYQIAGIVFR